jgi:hypothetical protein
MQEAADDDHRMRPHDVDHRVASKFAELVGADHRVVVTTPDIVHARFEFNPLAGKLGRRVDSKVSTIPSSNC